MKALRNYIDKIKPQFEKGGKFEKLHSTFEGFETFLFVPDKVTFKGSHIRDVMDLKRTMIVVVLAVVPAMLFGMWNVGFQHFKSLGEVVGFWDQFLYGFLKVLPLIVVSYVVGLGIEFAFARRWLKSLRETISNGMAGIRARRAQARRDSVQG